MNRNRRLHASTPPHALAEVLFPADRIRDRVAELVDEICGDLTDDDLVLIGLLRGSFMFLADLVRGLYRHDLHPRIDFMMLGSYGDATDSSGLVEIHKDFSLDVHGADVLIIDDILDTGRTLSFARTHVANARPHSVRTCVLLDKPSRRALAVEADFRGFQVEDHFVVGYGLDFAGFYRDLPYIARLNLVH